MGKTKSPLDHTVMGIMYLVGGGVISCFTLFWGMVFCEIITKVFGG